MAVLSRSGYGSLVRSSIWLGEQSTDRAQEPRIVEPSARQRKAVCVKRLVGAACVVCPCSSSGSGCARQRVIGLRRRRTGLPAMSDEVLVGPRCRVGLAPTVSLMRSLLVRPRSWSPPCIEARGAVGGDGRVPHLAGGGHGVQVPKDRRSDHALGLLGHEPVGLAGGEVAVAGGVDGVGLQRTPDRAPSRQTELRAA